MLYIQALILICADTGSEPSAESEFQRECMHKFLRVYPHFLPRLHEQGLIRDDHSINDVCSFRCAQCLEGQVDRFIWEFDRQKDALLPMFSVDWLPPTTTVFHLKSCALTQSIKTPRLPRGLVYIFIRDCVQADEAPMCVPDMSSLPKTLRQLFILNCALSGTMNFTDLPAGIQVIQMSQISDILVDMRTLPSSLYLVNLANGSKKVQKHIIGKDKLDERFSRGDAFIGKLKTDIQLQCIRHMKRIRSELEGHA